MIEAVRQHGIRTPVLVLSALSAVDDRVTGLKAGGDDYLTKPFAMEELMARVEALLRRPDDTRSTTLRVGPLSMDLIERRVWRDGREIELLPREFRLLEYLMRRPGQVLTRSMMLEDVWQYRFIPRTNLVDVHIGKLRRKVDAPGEEPLIRSIRGTGSCCVFLTELFRTATFRLTLAALAAMAGVMVMQFGLVYTQMEAVESRRSTELLRGESRLLAQMTPEHLEYVIRKRATDDMRLVISSAGLFDASHALIAGDLHVWPRGWWRTASPIMWKSTRRKGRPTRYACWLKPCRTGTFWFWAAAFICSRSKSLCCGTQRWLRPSRPFCSPCCWAWC